MALIFMRSCVILGTILLLLLSLSYAVCKEVAYVYGEERGHPAGEANLTDYDGKSMVSFTIAAPPGGTSVSQKTQKPEEFFKKDLNEKINIGNQLVRDEGLRLTGRRSGAQRVDQICSIYDYMVGNWTYVSDPRGLDLFQYSNYTLEMGREVNSSGKGDCDDFAILMASLIDSIGGTPRIILAYGPAGGHAYTEVYLGKTGGQDRDVDRILKWLRSEYRMNEINCHTDPISGDVWLNLDWWKDPGGANHPGGRFYQAATQIPINIREDIIKIPLTPIENLPPKPLFSYSPIQPEVGEVVSFNASGSFDPDGKIVDYEWDFGDGDTAHGISKSICQHIYSSAEKFQANLTVTDNGGGANTKTSEINVKEPLPEAIGTYSPTSPKVDDVITFDASQSKDKRGRITDYEWDFDDGYSGKRVSIDHQYLKSGTYDVKLAVTNDRGIQNTSTITVVVSDEIASAPVPAPTHRLSLENQTNVTTNAMIPVPGPSLNLNQSASQSKVLQFSKYYTVTPHAPSETLASPTQYELKGQEPAMLYFGTSQKEVPYSQYQSYSLATGLSNSLWIQGSSSWTQYAQVPQGASLSLLARTSSRSNGYLYEVYPNGALYKNSYYFFPGSSQIDFLADKVGEHLLFFVIDGQPSNVVVIDCRD
jgi:PKD repeat protein